MLCGHTVQLLSQLLCCAHYRHEEGLSIHLPTSTPILYAHLSSSHLALHHLTRLQLFVSPFHPWSLSRPHLSASASSLPLTFSHLPHLSFVHLVPSISCSPWLFPSLSDVSVAFLQWLMYICRSWVTPGCVTNGQHAPRATFGVFQALKPLTVQTLDEVTWNDLLNFSNIWILDWPVVSCFCFSKLPSWVFLHGHQ